MTFQVFMDTLVNDVRKETRLIVSDHYNLQRRTSFVLPVVAMLIVGVLAGCGKQEPAGISSYLAGTISLRDTTVQSDDNAGFRVMVLAPGDGKVDTLALATTDAAGYFSTTVRAREMGMYPLVIRRSGGILASGQLIVADGDSATVSLSVPLGNKPFIVRSKENGAWLAYQNAKATYGRTLSELASSGKANDETLRQTVFQSVGLMTNLNEVYPNTLGANLASVEALMMLGSLRSAEADSIVAVRIRNIRPENPGYVDAARVGWRSTARAQGLGSAIALLDSMRMKVDGADKKAALQSEVVLAYQDSLRYDDAREASTIMLAAYSETDWREWAESAIYELDHLRIGQTAPDFDVVDRSGRRLRLSEVQTPWIVLEFYEPRNEIYQRELPTRRDFLNSPKAADVTFISVSLEGDDDVNDAFQERGLAGRHVVARNGFDDDLSKKYNVKFLPKRILIGNGIIVGKYSGQALNDVLADIADGPV